MKVYSDIEQYSWEWWSLRRGVPTASCFGKLITPAKGDLSKQADGYICELIADRYDPEYGVVDDYVTAAMKNGHLMEPEARRFYEFERDTDVQQVGFCMDDNGRFGCSPDGFCGESGALEVKAPLPKTHVAYLLDGGLPVAFKPQIHGSLIVTGREWWDLLVYCPGFPPLLVRVEPDEYTAKVRSAMAEFWDRYQIATAKVEAMGGFPEPAERPTPQTQAEAEAAMFTPL